MAVTITIVTRVVKTVGAVALAKVQIGDEVCGRPSIGRIVEYSAIPSVQWSRMACTDSNHEMHSRKREERKTCLTIHYSRRRSGLRIVEGSGLQSGWEPAGEESNFLTFKIGSLEVRALITGVLQRLGAFPVVQNRVGSRAGVIVGSYDEMR